MRTLQWDSTTSPERSAGQIPTNRTVRVTKLTSRHRVSNQGYVQRLILNKKKREREREKLQRRFPVATSTHTRHTTPPRESLSHRVGSWNMNLWIILVIYFHQTLSRNIYIWPRKTQENKSLKQATDFFSPAKISALVTDVSVALKQHTVRLDCHHQSRYGIRPSLC